VLAAILSGQSLAAAQHSNDTINLLIQQVSLSEKGGKQIVRSWTFCPRIHSQQANCEIYENKIKYSTSFYAFRHSRH